MNVKHLAVTVLAALLCGCVSYAPEVRDSAEKQFSYTFAEALHKPAVFAVYLRPPDASRLVNGVREPLRLHTLLEDALRQENMLATDAMPATYVIIVEKQAMYDKKDSFSRAYAETMARMSMGEAPSLLEITIERLMPSDTGERVFGRRVASFSATLLRPEEELARDIADVIIEKAQQ